MLSPFINTSIIWRCVRLTSKINVETCRFFVDGGILIHYGGMALPLRYPRGIFRGMLHPILKCIFKHNIFKIFHINSFFLERSRQVVKKIFIQWKVCLTACLFALWITALVKMIDTEFQYIIKLLSFYLQRKYIFYRNMLNDLPHYQLHFRQNVPKHY